jgi:cytoskeletal protein CcmA (bactofilin family)
VEIKGSIKFSNDLVVDGKIEGSILSDGSLTVGENARIKAEIKTRSVVIYGKVYGNIEVSHTVELKANCELVGDIKAASLSIEPGSIFVGKSMVGTPTSQPQAAAKTDPAKSSKQPAKPQQPIKAPAKKEEQPKLPKQAELQNQQNKHKSGNAKAPQPMGKAPQPIKKP